MYLIYEVETGEPRIEVSSMTLAEANLGEGEAYIELENEDIDTDRILVLSGQIVPKEKPAFDPVRFARHVRSGFLADTDWTQVTDNSLSGEIRQAWASYRQELRDFPAKIAAIAADEELAGNVSTMHQVEELLPTPPDGG